MADSFVQGSFAFTCTTKEAALIDEAWQIATGLACECEPALVSPEFLTIFPPINDHDPFSGFTAIFDDPAFPEFGADLAANNPPEDPKTCTVSIYSTTDFQPGPIAALIQRCCQDTLEGAPIGFDWSFTCTRPYRDSFGGGWCAIFPKRIEFQTTREALSKALEGEQP